MSLRSDVVEALNEFNETEQNAIAKRGASHTRQNPLPDPGIYDAAFSDVGAFTTEARADSDVPEGTRLLNVRLQFTIQGGGQDGQVLERTFWGNSEWDFAALSDFVTVLTGKKPLTSKDAVLFLDGAEGTKTRLKVKQDTIKNGERKGELVKKLYILG